MVVVVGGRAIGQKAAVNIGPAVLPDCGGMRPTLKVTFIVREIDAAAGCFVMSSESRLSCRAVMGEMHEAELVRGRGG